jgi:hypothetical protein
MNTTAINRHETLCAFAASCCTTISMRYRDKRAVATEGIDTISRRRGRLPIVCFEKGFITEKMWGTQARWGMSKEISGYRDAHQPEGIGDSLADGTRARR